MVEVPFELRYQLTRWQRLVPHLILWGPLSIVIPLTLPLLVLGVMQTWWAVFLVIPLVFLFGGFFYGLADVVFRRTAMIDLLIEENGLGFLAGGQRWWLFLDGLIRIEQLTGGVWTLQHHNGSVVNIPAHAISEAQLDYLRAAMARGHTPEGMQTVIERGRWIAGFRRR
jgi:hypothetical protein